MAPFPCHLQALLPEPSELRLKQIERIGNLIFIVVATTRLSVSCPVCNTPSSRIHSRYQRVLRDLPWHGAIVRMRLLCRRFYCRSPECSRRIFTERIPKVVRRYGRFTERSRQVLSLIGYALGGDQSQAFFPLRTTIIPFFLRESNRGGGSGNVGNA